MTTDAVPDLYFGTPAELEEALRALPPARQAQGDPGHDQAGEYLRGIKLIRLRRARLTYAQIAAEMGYYDASAARQALLRALDRHEADDARTLRILENHALDADESTLRGIIGNTQASAAERIRAVDARTRLSARRSRLNGLDAPIQVAISAGVEADLADALTDLAAILAETGVDVVPGTVLSSATDTPLEAP